MKSWIFLLALASLSGAAARANPALDCFSKAINDPSIFPGVRAWDAYEHQTNLEATVVSLCAGASDAQAVLDCYQGALKDPAILAGSKAYDALSNKQGTGLPPSLNAERAAISLCKKAASAAAVLGCYKTGLNDPTVLKAAKARDAAYPPSLENGSTSEAERGLVSLCGNQ